MISSKQRAALRAMANELEPIFQLGKDGLGDAFVRQVDEALEARELVKISILRTSEYEPRQACDILADKLGAQGVQCIGRKFTLYRPSTKNPRIGI
ncbi:MAG: YhbY family RNA-binding protein [Christensenellales bacterium]